MSTKIGITRMKKLYAEAIFQACRECGLEEYALCIEKVSRFQNHAEKIVKPFFYKGIPVKKSFMRCEGLDMCFFFTKDGSAMYSYAGLANAKDADEGHIVKAFQTANRMRAAMEKALKELLEKEENRTGDSTGKGKEQELSV